MKQNYPNCDQTHAYTQISSIYHTCMSYIPIVLETGKQTSHAHVFFFFSQLTDSMPTLTLIPKRASSTKASHLETLSR